MLVKRPFLLLISLLAVASLTCSAPGELLGSFSPKTGSLSEITFCERVSESGKCVGETTSFPAGSTAVWAYFTYKDMKDGQKWSRVWEQDGQVYDEARDQNWSDGTQGWDAYSLEDPAGLSGNFTLTISLGDQVVQKASFKVVQHTIPAGESAAPTRAPAETQPLKFAAFGPITMAKDVTEDNFPIGSTDSFEAGTKIVHAVFPFSNMSPNKPYTIEWLRDGTLLTRDDKQWQDSIDGMHSASLEKSDALKPGSYTLNLYLDNQLARSVNFEVQGALATNPQPTSPPQQKATHPDRPARPEEVVDPDALKYFYMISQANLPVLNQVVNDNLKGWTRIQVTNDNPCGPDTAACFVGHCDRREEGTIYMPRENFTSLPDFRVTAVLTHELTHGMELYDGMKCGCTVEKEYYAIAAELDFMGYSGHMDYMEKNYGLLWDNAGNVRTDRLWAAVKKAYLSDNCPEY